MGMAGHDLTRRGVYTLPEAQEKIEDLRLQNDELVHDRDYAHKLLLARSVLEHKVTHIVTKSDDIPDSRLRRAFRAEEKITSETMQANRELNYHVRMLDARINNLEHDLRCKDVDRGDVVAEYQVLCGKLGIKPIFRSDY
jgi:hypothetical protein